MRSQKYLIYTIIGFDKAIGGIVALHKLCHDLRSLGQDAYISHGPTGRGLNSPQYSPTDKELFDEFIVVYPENIIGNPLHCPRVVRWILNTPGAYGPTDFYKHEKKSDLVFKFSDFFDYAGKGNYKGVLQTLYTDFETFRNHGLQRSGSCYLVKKGKVTTRMHDENSVLLDNHGDWENIACLLNTKEILYCYDNATYWSALAALCGCVCLVIPDGTKTPEEWHACFPQNKFGVAYGSDELHHARQTLSLVAGHIQGMEQERLKSVKNFVAEITNHSFPPRGGLRKLMNRCFPPRGGFWKFWRKSGQSIHKRLASIRRLVPRP
jgi:hypothetical protein